MINIFIKHGLSVILFYSSIRNVIATVGARKELKWLSIEVVNKITPKIKGDPKFRRIYRGYFKNVKIILIFN